MNSKPFEIIGTKTLQEPLFDFLKNLNRNRNRNKIQALVVIPLHFLYTRLIFGNF